ncbi:hypothetical protein [Vibrio gallaecicus]|uniref:hypothetical protein n=1 Tax=Vibrio gallaecicus TaxID=552386 RepID=UPI0025B3BBEB|nr:hypothetical protein [Vibrio gallaecicus]MDN3614664.1 hypothetical protein [Vibrio gallaecicus]MDN3615701.1 hypothetical protein [Vibrio gallaecicus]
MLALTHPFSFQQLTRQLALRYVQLLAPKIQHYSYNSNGLDETRMMHMFQLFHHLPW